MIGEVFIRNISDFPLKAHLSGIFFSGCASCFFTSFFIFIISPSVSVVKYARNSYREAEKEIIILRYGLNNKKPLTQREVAQRLNISRSYVSRIEKAGLKKLRKLLE